MRVKIATFNVNGVNGRLPRLLEWLDEARPDVACLQEIKTGDATFPAAAIESAGYRAVWHGQRAHHGVAVLARGAAPSEVRRGLPGDASDAQARYLEADVLGLADRFGLPAQRQSATGPKFDYKLAWFERLIAHARTLIDSGRDVVLAGDFNVVPTNADIYNWWLWRFDAVAAARDRALHGACSRRAGSMRRDASIRRAHLHLLGQRQRVPAQRRLSHGLPPAHAGTRGAADATGVDVEQRGRERASDHAPVWIELDG
jgi:exodeoxyribonuclease-3